MLLPCFRGNNAVVNRGMRCLCKSLLSPLLGTFPYLALLDHAVNSVFNCLRHCHSVVNGLCSILSPPTEHKWSFLYILANTYYFMGFWINMKYFNEQLPPWALGHSPSGVSGRHLGTVPMRGQRSWHISLPNPILWLRPTEL